MKRTLGRSGIEVSALGLGCWPIANAWKGADGIKPQGYGVLDDQESIRAIQEAVDHGISLFDTSNIYGCGHGESILGQALVGRRSSVVLATKFGYDFNESTGLPEGAGHSPLYIRKSLEGSLRRLQTDHIELFQFHDWGFPPEEAGEVRETLEELVREGKILTYGWSTDVSKSIEVFAQGPNCSAAQMGFNVFKGNVNLLKFCEEENLAVLCRSPLAMGLLSDKYHVNSRISGEDIRATDEDWMSSFKNGRPSPELIQRRDQVKEILRSGGRSTVQGAVAWLWGKSPNLIPIPGFKNTHQALEHAKSLEKGPLAKELVEEVEKLVRFEPVLL